MLLGILVSALQEDLPEYFTVIRVTHRLDEGLSDFWSALQDVNHDLTDVFNARISHHTSQYLEADLPSNLESIDLGAVIHGGVSHALQNLQYEVKEFGAVDVTLERKFHVVLEYAPVDIVSMLSVGGLPVRSHEIVLLLLLIVLDLISFSFPFFDFVFSNDDFERFLDTALVEEHVT